MANLTSYQRKIFLEFYEAFSLNSSKSLIQFYKKHSSENECTDFFYVIGELIQEGLLSENGQVFIYGDDDSKPEDININNIKPTRKGFREFNS